MTNNQSETSILRSLFLKNPNKKIQYNNEYIYPVDKLQVKNGDKLKITFQKGLSNTPQALGLYIDKHIKFLNKKKKSVAFWYDESQKHIDIEICTENGILLVENGWEDKDGEYYFCEGNAALKVEQCKDGSRTYTTNYGFSNLNFDGIVFNIKDLSGKKLESLMD